MQKIIIRLVCVSNQTCWNVFYSSTYQHQIIDQWLQNQYQYCCALEHRVRERPWSGPLNVKIALPHWYCDWCDIYLMVSLLTEVSGFWIRRKQHWYSKVRWPMQCLGLEKYEVRRQFEVEGLPLQAWTSHIHTFGQLYQQLSYQTYLLRRI
jgi:hypothetical protein